MFSLQKLIIDFMCVCEHPQPCPTPCNLVDCSLPGSSVHELSQARNWSWFPFPPPEDLPDPGMKPLSLVSPGLAGGFFTAEPPGKTLITQRIMKGNIYDV